MRKTLTNLIILTFCCSFTVTTAFARQSEQNRQISLQIKIEYFDWYSEREVPQPPAIKIRYRQSLPEGKSANFPTEDSSRQKEPEKFIYRIRIRNLTGREIESVVWSYEFFNPLTKELAGKLEFDSRVRIKPNKRKTIYAESLSPPTQIIDANLLRLNKKQPFLESVVIKSLVFFENSGRVSRLYKKN